MKRTDFCIDRKNKTDFHKRNFLESKVKKLVIGFM